MTKIIADANQELLEEVITNFMNAYPWFSHRISNMEQEHRDAIGILLETHPDLMSHLKTVFDRNLTEDGFEMKEEGHWYVTRSQYTLLGFLSIMSDGDELHLLDYKKSSGIIGLDGVELDSTI